MCRLLKWLKHLLRKSGSLIPERDELLKFDCSKLERYFDNKNGGKN